MSAGDLVSEIKPDAPVGLFERQSMFGPWIEVERPTDKSVPLYTRPAAHDDLVGALQRLVDWNTKYPSSRVFSHSEVVRIAKEMDEISEKASAALAKAIAK